MSEQIKDGKKPLSSKKKPTINQITADDLGFGNALHLPPEIQADLDAQGLEAHWMNATKLFQMGGYHPKGWTPYRRKATSTSSLSEFKIGTDPDGILRRGDSILGVKPKEQAEKHRLLLKQKAQRLAGNNQASELDQFAKQAGVKMKIYDGFEENE